MVDELLRIVADGNSFLSNGFRQQFPNCWQPVSRSDLLGKVGESNHSALVQLQLLCATSGRHGRRYASWSVQGPFSDALRCIASQGLCPDRESQDAIPD